MAYNKIVYGGNVLIDLTEDTVSADKLLSGVTAHDKSGEEISGTCPYDADTSDATAAAGDILTGKTAYKNGAKVSGTMANKGAVTGTLTGHRMQSRPFGWLSVWKNGQNGCSLPGSMMHMRRVQRYPTVGNTGTAPSRRTFTNPACTGGRR